MLIGCQFNNNNAADVCDPESPLQSPLAELNGVKGLADQFEQLFKLAGGVKGRVQALLKLCAACPLGAQYSAGSGSGHGKVKWKSKIRVFYSISTNILKTHKLIVPMRLCMDFQGVAGRSPLRPGSGSVDGPSGNHRLIQGLRCGSVFAFADGLMLGTRKSLSWGFTKITLVGS